MRTKNGKWIGPVPVALVAALALAAFLSVGLWLLPDGSSPAHAQGITDATEAESTLSGDKCGVSIDGKLAAAVDMRVAGGDCNVGGDSVDVVFQNTAIEPTEDEVEAGADSHTVDLVAYATGGTDFASVQARDGETLLGKQGVDEYLFTLDHQTESFGTTTPGTEMITVTRSMSGEDGKVYIFAYYNDDDDDVNVAFQVINGRIDVDGDGVITVSDDRARAETLTADENVNTTELGGVGIINGEIDVNVNGTVGEDDNLTIPGDFQIINGLLYEKVTGDSPVNLGNTESDVAGHTPAPIMLMNGLANVDGDDNIDGDDERNPTAGDDNDAVTANARLASSRIVIGQFDINDNGSIDTGGEDDDYTVTGTEYLIIDGVFWGPRTEAQPTSANFVPGDFNQDIFDRDSPLHVPFAQGREGHFAGFGPMNTVPADIVVVVQFLDSPALGEDEDDDDKVSGDEVRSKLVVTSAGVLAAEVTDGGSKTFSLVPGATQAMIVATVQDKYSNPIEDAEVSFVATSVPVGVESSTRTEDTGSGGMATRTIEGLPEKGPFKVTVVVTVGDLELGTVIIAKAGPLDSVTAAPCTTLVGDAKVKDAKDACGADHDPQMVFDPDDTITIVAKAVDSLDNSVTPIYTLEVAEADEDNFGTPGRFSDGVASIKVDDEGASGEYMLTVKAEQGSGDNKITKTTEIEVIITGELDHYAIEGDDRILPREIKEFVVEAQDGRGNPAQFNKDQLTGTMHEVSIFVDGDTDMVSVLDLGVSQKADLAAGKETFRIRAHPGAFGEIEISVVGPSKGGVASVTKIINIGANQMPMAGDAIADQMIDMGATVMVQSTLSDPEDDMLYYAWASDDDMIATVMADDMDMSMATITGVAGGSAMITVTATDTEGGMGMQTFMVTVEYANVAPTAGADIDPVMMTVGGDPMMVATMFTDANMDDMLSYTEMSSDEMVATAMVDMDGMVTITAVGAGEATITVTATDMDGESAMQTIMVTVMMAPMMDELGTPTGVVFGFNEGGALQVSWTKAANGAGYIIIAVNTNDVNNDVVVAITNDGDDETQNISGLTRGATYQVYVAATGSGVDEAGNAKFELSAPAEVMIK